MRDPLVLYSTNTWLAYAIAERYYGGVHYVWCSPVYDGSTAERHVNIPPSSSPADLYRALLQDTERGERHSELLNKNRKGLEGGSKAKLLAGTITKVEQAEIAKTLETADLRDFRPVLYVIPFECVRGMVVEVPVPERAHPMSVEYRIEELPRDCFDLLELRV